MNQKVLICIFAVFIISAQVKAQSWVSGNSKIYVVPDTTKVGVGIINPSERFHVNKGALKIGNSSSAIDRSINMLKFGDGNYVTIGEWEADDMLSFKANKYNFTNGNVGIGVSNPQYKLDINGKVFIHHYDNISGFYQSYLQWESHKLLMGVIPGNYAHTILELMPGGSAQGELFSRFSMYHAQSESQKVEKIRFSTSEHCWINNGLYFGIGTNAPQYALDVRGTIRANEILVNIPSGADFVFDESYNLLPLAEVSSYIQKKRHLPDIPSAAEMQENGVSVNELQIQLLQKIEELTLYIIQQEQRIFELESMITQ